MTTLLIVNAVALGLIGALFSLMGSNFQSRLMGIISLLIAVADVVVLAKVTVL